MSAVGSVTVVGGGLAGFTTARELRSRGFAGPLRIVDPQGLPYDRPPLSKTYLAGSGASIGLVPADWFAEHAVEIVTDTVVRLWPDRGTVALAGGGELASDAVVLATGGIARRLPVPGGGLPGVLSLRGRADADALRAALAPGTRLAVIGAGLIGAEVAATAVGLGVGVTIVDPVPVPLVAAVGAELAGMLHGLHAEHGVEVVTGSPSRIRRDGTALRVDIGDRDRPVRAEVVLVAVGIEVDTGLAESAGLAVDGGVVVDGAGRTSHPGVWAAGDGVRVRRADGTLGRRSEHWEAAMLGGAAVAGGILGQPVPARPPAWFWSERYGARVEAVGSMAGAGRTVLRRDPAGPMVAFRIDDDGVLAGAAGINAGKAIRAARRLIARRAVVAAEELADPGVDLRRVGA